MTPYFAGQEIWGDDFDQAQRWSWFEDERDAYAQMYAAHPDYSYEYHAVNRIHGFRWLPKDRVFRKALGLGSAYGDELTPLADRISSAVLVESSERYAAQSDIGMPLEWRKADPMGDLPLADGEVDLAVSFGVLHHIANVSHVVREMGRVVEPGGFALIREPVVSMGDWRLSRPGLTPRERGIPRALLNAACQSAGLTIVRETSCFFPGTPVIARALGWRPYEHASLVRLDRVMSRLTNWNYRYHPKNVLQKIRPTCTFLVLRRS